MADAVLTTKDGVDNAWTWFGEFLHTVAQENLYPRLHLSRFGQQVPMPANSGLVIHIPQWVRKTAMDSNGPIGRLSVSLEPKESQFADESGTARETAKLELTQVSASIVGFGGVFAFSDLWMHVHEIPGAMAAGIRSLSADMALAYEEYVKGMLLYQGCGFNYGDWTGSAGAATNCIQLGASESTWGSVSNTDVTTVRDLFAVYREFESKLALPWPGDFFEGVFHPRVVYDLFTNVPSGELALGDWLSTERGQGAFERNRIRILGGIAINKSTINTAGDVTGAPVAYSATATDPGSAFASGQKGFFNMFFAPGAFAISELEGMRPNIIIQPYGSGGATGDPLKRYMTVGMKGFMATTGLDLTNRFAIMATGSSSTP